MQDVSIRLVDSIDMSFETGDIDPSPLLGAHRRSLGDGENVSSGHKDKRQGHSQFLRCKDRLLKLVVPLGPSTDGVLARNGGTRN